MNIQRYVILQRRRKVLNIGREGGGGGGQGSEYWGAKWGGRPFAGCKLPALAPNQCQIMTFLTLKTDNIEKLRIELKSILFKKYLQIK